MENHSGNAGVELLSLLRKRRYLYHQLKMLSKRQQQLAGAGSPEQILEVVNGRRKLIEKLRAIEEKFRLIKTNWQKLAEKIKPEHKAQASKIESEIEEIISEIQPFASANTNQSPRSERRWKLDELLAEA